jgi:hypothetical protein
MLAGVCDEMRAMIRVSILSLQGGCRGVRSAAEAKAGTEISARWCKAIVDTGRFGVRILCRIRPCAHRVPGMHYRDITSRKHETADLS